MSRKVEREFKDPDIPTGKKHIHIHPLIRVILLIGIASGIFFIILSLVGSDPVFASNETQKAPEYIHVDYGDGKFHVKYNNTSANYTTVIISLVSRDYPYPIEVFSSDRGNVFDISVADHEWGHEYLLSVVEEYGQYNVRYHWVVSKTQIGYTTVRPL